MTYLLGESEEDLKANGTQKELDRMRLGQTLLAVQTVLTFVAIPYGIHGMTGSYVAALILGPALAATVRFMYRLLMQLLPGPKPTQAQLKMLNEGRYWEKLLFAARQRLSRAQSLLSRRAGRTVRVAIVIMLALAVSKPFELVLFGEGSRARIEQWKQRQHQTVQEESASRDPEWAGRQHEHIEEATLFFQRVRWMHRDSPWCLCVTLFVVSLFWVPLFFKARVLAGPNYGAWRIQQKTALHDLIISDVHEMNVALAAPDPQARALYEVHTEPEQPVREAIPTARLNALLNRFKTASASESAE